MSVAKIIEISSSSPKGIEDAVTGGLKRASKSIKNIKGAWVNDIKVDTSNDGKVTEWKEFGLPGFQGWFIRALHTCKGRFLEIRFDGKLSHRYRWNGQGFAPVPIKRTAR